MQCPTCLATVIAFNNKIPLVKNPPVLPRGKTVWRVVKRVQVVKTREGVVKTEVMSATGPRIAGAAARLPVSYAPGAEFGPPTYRIANHPGKVVTHGKRARSCPMTISRPRKPSCEPSPELPRASAQQRMSERSTTLEPPKTTVYTSGNASRGPPWRRIADGCFPLQVRRSERIGAPQGAEFRMRSRP